MDEFLSRIITWADSQSAIKAVFLVGSRAATQEDIYSDYDIAFVCSNFDAYVQDEKWLSEIANVWVCVHEKTVFDHRQFPTRLVIFEGGIKVDFGFYTLDCLKTLESQSLPDEYHQGYKVLLDKDALTLSLPKPSFKDALAKKPSKEAFETIIKEFWFEGYHVGVYLKREDLWSVKFRSWAAQTFLLQMIQWHAQATSSENISISPNGKRMSSWLEESLWHDLNGIFAHFDVKDSWKALFKLMDLFERIAAETAKSWGFDDKKELAKKIRSFITSLQ